MGAAGSKLSQRGIQQLQKLKTAVDSMPSGDITPQMLDSILENQSFTPKTDALFKQVREKMEREMKDSSSDFANSFAYAQQKDEQFVSKLTGDFRSMASETVNKEELPIESTSVLPQDRSSTPYEAKHIPGKLTTEELQSLFSNEDLIVNASGREQLARLYDLPEDSLDALLRYVAIPKMEKRREETKELDAVWPKWK